MKIIAKNKTAYRDYQILDKFEAGIVLTGSEVKSIKNGNVNIKDAYVSFKSGEAELIGVNISRYAHEQSKSYDPVRKRKLLLHKKEIQNLALSAQRDGLTIVPLIVYEEKGKVKVEIGSAKGRKKYDKREVIKKREFERNLKTKEKKRW